MIKYYSKSNNKKPTHQATFYDKNYIREENLGVFCIEFKEIDSSIGTMYSEEDFERMIKDYKEVGTAKD